MTDKERIYKSLGITLKKHKKKIKPKGSDFLKVRKIVKLMNKKFSSAKPKFVGFFPNLENEDNRYYVLTSDYYIYYSQSFESYRDMVKKMFPSVKVIFEHMHGTKAYYQFRDEEGIYIT